MALRMVALVRAKDGNWFARKGIPEDVRDPYARLFGVRREAHLRLPRDTPHHEAKTRCAEWIVDQTKISGVLAILDADFARILNVTYSSPNIVLSDFHDFEMTLLKSNALERLLTEDGSREKIRELQSKKPILDLLIDACLPLGCLRFYSLKTSSNLKFKGLRHGHLGRKLQVNIDDAIKEVFDHSQIHTGHEKAKVFIENFSFAGVDLNQLVSGHDMMAALGIALQSLIGSRNAVHCSVSELESKLRLGFSLEDFMATRTFAETRAWELRNVPFRCLH